MVFLILWNRSKKAIEIDFGLILASVSMMALENKWRTNDWTVQITQNILVVCDLSRDGEILQSVQHY
jgi:hypothetical protein